MKNHYTTCAGCGKMYTSGTLSQDHAGYGKRTITPQGRWHYASEVRTVRYARVENICPACGGAALKHEVKVNCHKDAAAAWANVEPGSALWAMRGKR